MLDENGKPIPVEDNERRFFEASWMHKYKGKYYFSYSTGDTHKLCYAIGDSPLGEFKYGGTLVSIGDVGLAKYPMNYLGNTHGSLIRIKDEYYVFYHRQTNRHCHSRQACAERIIRNPDGTFKQAEITSCGLNGGPLKGEGTYPAYIACHLYKKGEPRFLTMRIPKGHHPYFTQTGKDREDNGDQYIANFGHDSVCGFRYFQFEKDEIQVGLTVKGKAKGKLLIKLDPESSPIGEIDIDVATKTMMKVEGKAHVGKGVRPLYFDYQGEGAFDIHELNLK